jgi:hypothetical protein
MPVRGLKLSRMISAGYAANLGDGGSEKFLRNISGMT